MQAGHPLDRPVWRALTTRQAHLARGDARALRLEPTFGPFAAPADASPESLTALVALLGDTPGDTVALVDTLAFNLPSGVTAARGGVLRQMTVTSLKPPDHRLDIVPLTEADAQAIYDLAILTEPGPFAARTHQLGDFLGVKVAGRLAAMTGERLKPAGFTEVSAVCTHPDHRGRGYAAALTHAVAARIVARGETPFLHVYPHNTGAIAVYEKLGFTLRREITLTALSRL